MNIPDPLSPYLPLALMVATLVALLRGLLSKDGVSKLDGKAIVLPIVLVVSFIVVVWSQLHAGLVWSKVAFDTPIVFVLAAGGATFLQRLKDRGVLALTGEVSDLKMGPPAGTISVTEIADMLKAIEKATGSTTTTTTTSHATITGTVEVPPLDPPAVPPAPPSLDVPPAPPAG